MSGHFLLLIDGSSLLSTQFFGNLPREILFAKTPEEKEKYFHKIMMTGKGVYTNAVFGFLRTLFRILKDQKPEYLAVGWDLTRDTFRREMYPDYKGNRSETMEPLRLQFELCQRVLKEMNIPQFMDERYEADDFLGTLSRKFQDEIPVIVYTKDHDYLQLVTEKTHMWLMHSTAEKTEEMYKKYHIDRQSVNVPDRAFELNPELVEKEFLVKPRHINSLKGLQGDASDNIKGVPGVGPQTAAKLIQYYGTVDELYRNIKGLDKEKTEALKKFWKEELGITRSPLSFLLKESETELCGEKSARLSELLATIKTDIALPGLQLSDLLVNVSRKGTEKVLEELEITSLKADFFDDDKESGKVFDFSLKDGYESLEEVYKRASSEKSIGIHYEPGLGISAAFKDESAVFIPTGFFVTKETAAAVLQRLFEKDVRIYSTDGKEIYKSLGLLTRDVSIAAYLLDPLRGNYPYDYVAKSVLSADYPGKETLLSKYAADSPDVSEENRLAYMCFRALTAALSGPVLDERLKEGGLLRLYEDIELPTMKCLSAMESRGILVKKEELKAYGEELKKGIERLEKEIYSLSGEEFNINSPKQLGTVLFEKLKIPYVKKKKTGYSTAADILEKLAPDYPVVSMILEYRTLSKLYSTYAEGLSACISDDGRIHGTFNQTITATGRISSTQPNLQNIPVRIELGRLIRKVFVPKEGCVFIDADYSQIELRVLAHLSGDENLINAYKDAKDIHALTASQVFHVPLSEVTPMQRRNAKAVNFGIVYGISAFSLSDNLSITRSEAEEYMSRYFETYPGIRDYLDNTVKKAREEGLVRTMYGRIRPIPELDSGNFNQRAFGERVAMNSPIQGTAADIMKIAMIRVEEALQKEGLKSSIVLQIHDELLLEAYLEEADRVEEILVREMENAAALSVRLEVEAKRGNSWYETK